MSNNNQNINELLTCKICKKYYINPIILPCSNNICEEHVNQKILKDNNSKIYKCDFCFKEHNVPEENEFILNQTLIEMINMNLHLDEQTKSTKILIDDLDKVNKEIDLIDKDPEDFIYSYFSKEKNKIDLKRETLISRINDISDEMFEIIKQQETDAKSNLSEKKNLINSAQFDFKKLTDQLLDWKEEIRNPKLSINRLDEIKNESSKLLNKNDDIFFEAKKKLLNEKELYFSPNYNEIKNEILGELFINNYTKNPITDSTILNIQKSIDLIKLCEFSFKNEFKLIYRATRDGFSAFDFHSKCNFIPNTLTIIKVKDRPHIFGGFTAVTWDGDDDNWDEDDNIWEANTFYKQDSAAFIFSLVNDDNTPIKFINSQNIEFTIRTHPSYGPTFGGGHDIYISSDSNINKTSMSNLGYTYQPPSHLSYFQYDSNEARSFLAGSRSFSTSEIEVFQVIQNE